MAANIHLLVHAGAPSTRQDDGRCATLAEAYLRLATSRPRRIQDGPQSAVNRVPQTSTRAPARIRSQTLRPANVPPDIDATVYLEDTQLAYTALESQLRSSSRSEAERTPARPHADDPRVPMAVSSPSKPQSRLSQSSYLVSPQLRRPKQGNRVQEYDQAQTLPRQVRNSMVNTISGNEVQPADGSDKENSAHDRTGEKSSELPTSYSLSLGTSTRSVDRPRLPEKSVSDPNVLATRLAKGTTKRAPSVAPKTAPRDKARESRNSKASAVQVSSKRPRVAADTSDPELDCFFRFPSQIVPPGPQTSIALFSTHVTPTLQHLVEQSAVSSSFNPISQTRELELSERGYWLVRCQDWSLAEKESFWETLEKSVPNAGWGVWCSRGLDEQLQDAVAVDEYDTSTEAAAQRHSFGSVRVYCWGEVVKHVFLLLYVASKSKVRRLGLQWIDSEGQVVVQMRQ